MNIRVFTIFLTGIFFPICIFSQQENNKLKIYFACLENTRCDRSYIVNQLTDYDFVRDRFGSDIQVIQTENATGLNTANVTLIFHGYNLFENLTDTIMYSIENLNSSNEIYRSALSNKIKEGIIKLNSKSNERQTVVDTTISNYDKYNLWQFSIGMSGNFSGDYNSKSSTLNINTVASRETSKSRVKFLLYNSFISDKYTFITNSSVGTDSIINISIKRDVKQYSAEYLEKVSNHFAFGLRGTLLQAVVANIASRTTAKGLIEYSLFDYKDFNTSRIYLSTELGIEYSKYVDTTIYLKIRENRLYNALSIQSSFTKKWGLFNFGVLYRYYISDSKQNSLFLGGGLEWSILKGLNLSLNGSYEFIHDQLSIPKEDATLEDLLTKRRILSTTYDYSFTIGIRYTFGSIYNSIVNPIFREFNY